MDNTDLAGVFSSPETISKGDDIKIKRNVSPFFPSSTRLSSVHCRAVSIFRPFSWLGGGLRVKRNPGEMRVIGVGLFSTVFINPDIDIIIMISVGKTNYAVH